MSKKSKKKFNKVDVQFLDDNLNLPTVASAIPPRRDRGGFGGFGSGGYGSNKPFEKNESDTGVWRRGPGPSSTSTPSFNSNRNNSFNSNRNNSFNSNNNNSFNSNNNNSFNSNRNTMSSMSSRNPSSFRSARSPPNDMNTDMDNPSDNNRNWRDKKKEQPKYTLNSTISSTTNANPWRKDNNNNNTIQNTEMQGRSAFGSKTVTETSNINSNSNSFSRNSFGSRTNDNKYSSSPGSSSTFGSSSSGSKFGGGGSKFGGGGSKFGGGGGGGGTSKFASGGGFGASVMENISNNGTARLTYPKNTRFSGIMDETKESKPVALQAPARNVSNRFKPPSSEKSEQTQFPGLVKPIGQARRHEKSVTELQREIRKMDMESNKLQGKKKEEVANVNGKNINKKGKDNKKGQTQPKTQVKKEDKKSQQSQGNKNKKQEDKKQQEKPKIDKKLVRKFNKDCLGQNKSIEINKDTEKLILFGLSQKENILTRNENNYEKIAQLLCGVIFNEQNINRKKYIDLNKIYDIIYNKTELCNEKKLFLALVLELLSLIEIKKSCLGVVYIVNKGNMMEKYLMNTPNIRNKNSLKEFEEYGLQYIYPLENNIEKEINNMIENKCDLKELIEYLKGVRRKQIIYTNYKIMNIILIYILNKYYFNNVSDNEEKNEEIAKKLMIDNGNKKQKNKTEFRILIELLHCKNEEEEEDEKGGDEKGGDESEEEEEQGDDDEDDEDDDDDDDIDIDSHSLLTISNIINVSSKLDNNNIGLISILKMMELNGLIAYKTIRKFVQCDDDRHTNGRLNALSKLTDWIVELDARQARIEMEKSNELSDDDNVDNTYAGNLLQQRKHKTASDYETISFVE